MRGIERIGVVGWRGMVGSVLMRRMRAEHDFDGLDVELFSTSQAGQTGPDLGFGARTLLDAHDLDALRRVDALLVCQGSDYTQAVHGPLRESGWDGYWIDAASSLRMHPEAVIVLDPVNRAVIDRALAEGRRDLIGGNCTVSLMLMATAGLFERGWVEWISAATYQAASGAGARQMRELVAQMRALGERAGPLLDDAGAAPLDLDHAVSEALTDGSLPVDAIGAPLAASLIPWIDRAVEGGRTREEWKGHAETNKILGLDPPVPVDGVCVRIGAMRCHSQALTIKLSQDVPLPEIEQALATQNDWVRLVPNEKEATVKRLCPAAVSGRLDVAVGRVRTMQQGRRFVSLFTVGDQLLWGAAEPLRRALRIVRGAL